MSVLGVCEWLEHTPVALMVRESAWGFQILAAAHIMGLALSVGTFVWFDLRLLGVALQRCRISAIYRALMPWAGIGFLVMFTTGLLLFAGSATAAYANAYVRVKLAAIVLAGINALAYHLMTERSLADWDASPRPPRAARMAGLASILLWATVVMAGRLISYTLY
jgi:hypothetical protein